VAAVLGNLGLRDELEEQPGETTSSDGRDLPEGEIAIYLDHTVARHGAGIHELAGVVILMIMPPLSFYLVRRDLPGQSIRLLALGIAWAVSRLSLFAACAARPVDQRLRLSGLTTRHLVGGRLLAMLTCGMVLATGYFTIVVIDQHVQRMWAVGLLLATTVLVAAPIGFLIAAVLS
jgi:hypothetical protein